jgi:uncharacterized protein (TIGR04141 family)
MATARLAICLFQDTITELNRNELIGSSSLVQIPFLNEGTVEAALYLRPANPSPPEWVDIVSSFGAIGISNLSTSSSGAILFLKISGRILGCCFGTSVAYIDKNNIETDFGLGVAYDKMIPSQTKSIQSWTPADNPVTNSRSATVPMNRTSFNIDRFIESITELSGFQTSDRRRILIKGKEFFSIPSPRTLNGIIELCNSCLESYLRSSESESYRALTSIRKIKDNEVIERMNQNLFAAIRNRSSDLYLVDYESFDNCDGYRLTPNGEKIEEVTLDDALSGIRSTTTITVDLLKTKKIFPISVDDEVLGTWPLYKCLFYSDRDTRNILYKGKWYDVDLNYIRSLEDFITEHQSADLALPAWNGTDSEGDYNVAAAETIGGQCWDKILYTAPEYNYGIEFCDILFNNNIIHVKKKSSSSLSSHLLLQTAVSAQLLSNDPRLKTWINGQMRSRFSDRHLINNNLSFRLPNATTFYIVLMSQRSGSIAETLPFFSLISFNIMIKRILALGYFVKITQV